MGEHVVVFKLGGEKYGVPISQVKEIINFKPPTVLPDMADYFEGVINLRGEVIPVINLAARFSIAAEAGARGQIIVVEINEHRVGLVVGEVTEVVNLPQDAVQQAPALVANITGYVYGIAQFNDSLMILLDLSRVFSAEQLAALDKAS
jgi:purine-binding chemotaxis protein CheW